ncbi:hypothetical protein FISHEDRAFT_32195 [Fistulina hepatica ATCC 64428]|uniref:Uncharacterized protein n=1 Tax=Fistulina hepatica ATCC 64428 TaxID=1128425 RepID=A0A0D7AQD6_9AGAR|nr:hypothetical protein FISHEDRAFT_32195 [Fistulina hepatica ATCC 64428]
MNCRWTSSITTRYAKRWLVVGGLCIIVVVFYNDIISPVVRQETFIPLALLEPASDTETDLPPLYRQYVNYERRLSQHDPYRLPPEGEHAKFVYMANHQLGVGFGNVLQEMILNAHLAYTLKRSMVFDNFTWSRDSSDFADFNGKPIPNHIPWSTMLSGPLVGGTYNSKENDVPRAVSKEYFRTVCPMTTIIRTDDVKAALGNFSGSGAQTMAAWVEKLGAMSDRCLEVSHDTVQIFDYLIFGSTGLIDIWPQLSLSPIVSQFGWSPLILSAYWTNRAFFAPEPSRFSLSLFRHSEFEGGIEGLLVIHIRRGDFSFHCNVFVRDSSTYNGFNTFDDFPDKFTVPPIGEDGPITPERTQIYFEHCYPTIPQIVARVTEVRRDLEQNKVGSSLRKLYVMTNGERSWLQELKDALNRAALEEGFDWEGISTSRDIVLTKEQKYVAQALDMYVAQRAQVIIGNGFSSLTSNAVMLRVAHGRDPRTTRFL